MYEGREILSKESSETRVAKIEKVKNITGLNTSLNDFFFNFLRLLKEVETLGENSGASSHT